MFSIRTRDDAARLRERLAARPSRVLIIGAGFIGSEVASICRELDLAVTVAERSEAPLVGALGGVIGRIAAEMQRDHGVDLRTGVSVTSLGATRTDVCRCHLSDGSTLDVDVAVVALGSIRNVEWLEGSGLAAGPFGVGCDAGGPSTSTAWRPTASTWRGRGTGATCCTSTSFSRWSMGQCRARR